MHATLQLERITFALVVKWNITQPRFDFIQELLSARSVHFESPLCKKKKKKSLYIQYLSSNWILCAVIWYFICSRCQFHFVTGAAASDVKDVFVVFLFEMSTAYRPTGIHPVTSTYSAWLKEAMWKGRHFLRDKESTLDSLHVFLPLEVYS